MSGWKRLDMGRYIYRICKCESEPRTIIKNIEKVKKKKKKSKKNFHWFLIKRAYVYMYMCIGRVAEWVEISFFYSWYTAANFTMARERGDFLMLPAWWIDPNVRQIWKLPENHTTGFLQTLWRKLRRRISSEAVDGCADTKSTSHRARGFELNGLVQAVEHAKQCAFS